MTVKQNFSSIRKGGEITRSERTTVNQQVETMLQDIKQKTGKVILVAITNRTSIELPAHFTQDQIDERVAKYIELHKSKI